MKKSFWRYKSNLLLQYETNLTKILKLLIVINNVKIWKKSGKQTNIAIILLEKKLIVFSQMLI